MDYIRKRLDEISLIYGGKGYTSAIAKSPEILSMPKLLIPYTIKSDGQVSIISKEVKKNHFIVIAEAGQNIDYIDFILNSAIGKVSLGINNIDRVIPVTIKLLKELSIVLLPAYKEKACVTLSRLINIISNKANSSKDQDPKIGAAILFLSDLRDYIAIELYLKPLFEKEGLSILDNWLIEYEQALNNRSGAIGFTQQLFSSLSSSNNQLVDNMYKTRLFLNDFLNNLRK